METDYRPVALAVAALLQIRPNLMMPGEQIVTKVATFKIVTINNVTVNNSKLQGQ